MRNAFPTTILALLSAVVFIPGLQGQIIYQEGFETDGNETRYTIEDGLISEPADHAGNGVAESQSAGPVYWARSSEVSVVGVVVAAPARRAVVTWHHEIPTDAVSAETKAVFESLVDWLTAGRSNLRALVSPGITGPGDQLWIDILTEKGFVIIEDNTGQAPPAADTIGLVIKTSAASKPTRFTEYGAPLLTYNASDHDDELTSSIGQSNARLTIETARAIDGGHLALGTATGDLPFVSGEQGFDTIGANVPPNAVPILSGVAVVSAPVDSLAVVDAMASGARPSRSFDGGVFGQADFSGGAGGTREFDHSLPGGPSGGFGMVATGKIRVEPPGTYGFALGADDGARLRIDFDKNGLSAADTILEVNASGGFSESIAEVTVDASGEYEYEWVAFNAGGSFGAEISVTFERGVPAAPPLNDLGVWTTLGDHFPSDGVQIVRDGASPESGISVTTYVLDEPPVEETRPLVLVIEAGDPLLGGLITGADGQDFFAGAGLDKFGNGGQKSLTLNPVNVAGQSDLKLTFAIAGTAIDFEPSDFLEASVAFNGSQDFQPVVRFTTPNDQDKFLSDGTTRVGLAFKDVSYDLPAPAGLTPETVAIRFDALTSWWNEIVAIDNIRVHSGPLIPVVTDPPIVAIRFGEGGTVTVEWDSETLQSAPTVAGPWTDEFDSSPLTTLPEQSIRFYRALR